VTSLKHLAIFEAQKARPFMNFFILFCGIFLSLSAMGTTVSFEYGSGHANSYCDGNMGWYCLDQVKLRAQQEATRNAEWACQSKRGKADTFLPTCNDLCTPFSIPPDASLTFVSCNSTCSIRCTLP
jgi:hypothetical protein